MSQPNEQYNYAPESPGCPEKRHALKVGVTAVSFLEYLFIAVAGLVALYGTTLMNQLSTQLSGAGVDWLIAPFLSFEFGPETSILSMVLSKGMVSALFVLLVLLSFALLVAFLTNTAAFLAMTKAATPVSRSKYANAALSTLRSAGRLNALLVLTVVLLSPFALLVLPVLLIALTLRYTSSGAARLAYKLRGPVPMMQP